MGSGPSNRRAAERQIASGLRTGWIALATFLGLIALSAALVLAFEHAVHVADDMSRLDERALVHRYLNRMLEASAAREIGIAEWQDAVDHLGAPDSAANRAWLDGQIGAYATNAYGVDRAVLLHADGRYVRGWRDGKPVDAAVFGPLDATIRTLIATARRSGRTIGEASGQITLSTGERWPVERNGMLLSRWAGGLDWIDNRAAIVTVISVQSDRPAAKTGQIGGWLVSSRALEPGTSGQMRSDLLLGDLAYADQAPASRAINAIELRCVAGKPLGWLTWAAKSPAPMMMRRATPMLIAWTLLFLGVLGGGSVVLRRSWRSTRELLASEAQARHNALHDAMTGLPNREHTMHRLRQELAACIGGAARGDVFVAYVDLDGFKVINDTMGHHIGDELVRQVALRLRRTLNAGDCIARFGGDEFVVLRRAEGGRAMADSLGKQIMALMREPFAISGHAIDISCSCGISWGPAQSEDPGELLRRADIALYRAKQRGRARYRCFTSDMDASVKLRIELETELRRAIARDELSVAYQPIVALDGAGIVGVEALLRWNHPERGPIRPDLFVPVAEQGGVMIPLGNWMLRHVFAECAQWPACDISVNLSPLQIMAGDFLATMHAILGETGMDPTRVVLEITEGVMLDRSDHVLAVLGELNRMGFRIALDDFGNGYSSLSYLRLFQFERIKIDRSFVSNIEGDRDAHAILCTIAALGRSLRMKVVAEGVETAAQAQLVEAAGCDMVQGFLYWKPMSGEIVRTLIDQAQAQRRLRTA